MSNFAIANRLLLALAFLSFAALVVAGPARAEEKLPQATVAVIDSERVLRESDAGKSARAQIKAQQNIYQGQFDEQEKKLLAEKEKLERQKALVAPEVWQQKVAEFQQKSRALQQQGQVRTLQLNKAEAEVRRQVQPVLRRVAAEVIKEIGANVLLDRGAVLIFAEQLDITKEVITRLNKLLPKIDISFEAPAK